MRALWIVPFALLLGSCATLDKGQCLGGDWEGIGLRDGAEGYPASRVQDHAKACGKHGVEPDVTAWDRGRERGLLQYCRPQKGFAVGKAGNSYADVCPPDLEPEFLNGYADGKLVYAARRERDEASSDVTRERDRADQLDKDLRREEARLADPNLKSEEREAVRAAIKRMREDRARALDALDRAQWAERRAQTRLDDLEARFTSLYGSW